MDLFGPPYLMVDYFRNFLNPNVGFLTYIYMCWGWKQNKRNNKEDLGLLSTTNQRESLYFALRTRRSRQRRGDMFGESSTSFRKIATGVRWVISVVISFFLLKFYERIEPLGKWFNPFIFSLSESYKDWNLSRWHSHQIYTVFDLSWHC